MVKVDLGWEGGMKAEGSNNKVLLFFCLLSAFTFFFFLSPLGADLVFI